MSETTGENILSKRFGKFVGIPQKLFHLGRYLTPEAKWIYATLCSFTNNKTEKTFPSYEHLNFLLTSIPI